MMRDISLEVQKQPLYWLVSRRDPSSDNNVVGASARLRRAPEFTARRLWWIVDGGD
jgi:hypothetical protein